MKKQVRIALIVVILALAAGLAALRNHDDALAGKIGQVATTQGKTP